MTVLGPESGIFDICHTFWQTPAPYKQGALEKFWQVKATAGTSALTGAKIFRARSVCTRLFIHDMQPKSVKISVKRQAKKNNFKITATTFN